MGYIKKVFETTSWGGMVRRSSGEKRLEDKRNPVRISAEDCVALLKEGIVLFVYRKKLPKHHQIDELGKIRIAWGTKDFDSLDFPVPIMNPGIRKEHGGEIYIDLESEHWRVARTIIGAYDLPFSQEEYKKLTDGEKEELETELLKATDLYDEYQEQKSVELAKEEARRKREEEKLAAAGIDTGGDIPVDSEI